MLCVHTDPDTSGVEQQFRIYGGFEHYKPPKSEERPTPPASLLDPSDLDPSGSTPGPGAQYWFNAAEFVPGQPYFGRAEPMKMASSAPLTEECDTGAVETVETIVWRHLERNRSTDDAISSVVHTSLTHLESRDSYILLLFLDFTSVLNTITPQTCSPQGCVLSPLLFTLLRYDCSAKHLSCRIVKFTDDTVVVGRIQNDDESRYREEVEHLVHWCRHNNLCINVGKTKEMVVDFRRKRHSLAPCTSEEQLWRWSPTTGLTTLTSGLYAGVSITVVWSDAPSPPEWEGLLTTLIVLGLCGGEFLPQQDYKCLDSVAGGFEQSKPPKSEEPQTPQTLMPPPSSLLDPSDLNPSGSTPGPGAQDWFNAAEFVPGQPYCGRAEPMKMASSAPLTEECDTGAAPKNRELRKQLCFYAAVGECRNGINCPYLHGEVCDMCGHPVLHPTDISQRSEHTKACMEAQKDMELSFAIQRSKDKMCGVCMEVVLEKANPSERRFGILSNCSHSYCLKCIRTWRRAKQFESNIIKSCPECRIISNFVIPSEYWVEDKDDKLKLIQKYKDGMRNKPCRYFDEGRGTCPFGAICFYKHAFPGGRLEEAQPPRRQPGSNDRNRNSRRTPLWNIFEEQESTDSFGIDVEEMGTFNLREMLLMLLAAGTDDEDEWDLFNEDLDDFCQMYL
ncbi:probable E3 ubiquitin-protein ligase makorin-1 [Antennarius striatus]|uniref:probable E3 ubiquitin-protein ligase makorin-1 n=1 Tax=Antennarius striatus TaxID=241820 RepID=UPI0035AE10D9